VSKTNQLLLLIGLQASSTHVSSVAVPSLEDAVFNAGRRRRGSRRLGRLGNAFPFAVLIVGPRKQCAISCGSCVDAEGGNGQGGNDDRVESHIVALLWCKLVRRCFGCVPLKVVDEEKVG
jgi:hypothetical protein